MSLKAQGDQAKTTTVWYLARELARAGKRVLLRDLDPQEGLTDILRDHGAPDGRFLLQQAETGAVSTDLLPGTPVLDEEALLLSETPVGYARLPSTTPPLGRS